MPEFKDIMVLKNYSPRCPASLKIHLSGETPLSITAIGNPDVLQSKPLAIFSSSKCPGSIILKAYDLMRQFRSNGITLISGFHSPMEQECLNILLKGKHSVIICPARSIEGMRIKTEYKKPLDDGRLLFISPFTEKEKRISAGKALERNRFVAAIADKIFIPYAGPNSKTETFCRELIEKGKPVLTFDGEHNENLIGFGAKVINMTTFPLMPASTKEAALQAYIELKSG
jgi:predicted Rossmann fold nucleotide-binding protein DprA/Smf involved in DNA uptake